MVVYGLERLFSRWLFSLCCENSTVCCGFVYTFHVIVLFDGLKCKFECLCSDGFSAHYDMPKVQATWIYEFHTTVSDHNNKESRIRYFKLNGLKVTSSGRLYTAPQVLNSSYLLYQYSIWFFIIFYEQFIKQLNSLQWKQPTVKSSVIKNVFMMLMDNSDSIFVINAI